MQSPTDPKDNRTKPIIRIEQARNHLGDSSKALSNLTASMVYDNPELYGILIDLSLLDERQYSERASRVVCRCSKEHPELFKPHSSRVIAAIATLKHEGPLRNLLKLLAEVPVKMSNKEKTILMNRCFDLLISGSSAVAIKVFSMQILYNLSLGIPEIGEELYRILGEQMEDASAGYRSRARRLMQKIR